MFCFHVPCGPVMNGDHPVCAQVSRITVRCIAGSPIATLPTTASTEFFLHPVRPHVYQGGHAMVIDSDDGAAINVCSVTRGLNRRWTTNYRGHIYICGKSRSKHTQTHTHTHTLHRVTLFHFQRRLFSKNIIYRYVQVSLGFFLYF